MANTPSSRKAKGRKLQNSVVEKLYEVYDNLRDGDIKPAIMGDSGVDVKMSPTAQDIIPFDIECKNQEQISIWKCLDQAEANASENRIPLLVFKRNRSKTYAVLEFDKLLQLLSGKEEK